MRRIFDAHEIFVRLQKLKIEDDFLLGEGLDSASRAKLDLVYREFGELMLSAGWTEVAVHHYTTTWKPGMVRAPWPALVAMAVVFFLAGLNLGAWWARMYR